MFETVVVKVKKLIGKIQSQVGSLFQRLSETSVQQLEISFIIENFAQL